jgi:tetratricopeptide (TPR) repeat protein
LGNYEMAEEQHQKALKALQEILLDDNLEITWTLNTLAQAYRKSGKITKALAMHQQALTVQEKALGISHPHPLWTRGDIGKWYLGLGTLDKSREILPQLLRRMNCTPRHHACGYLMDHG